MSLSIQIEKKFTLKTLFFERHLNNQKSPLLNDFSSPYPEVTFQSHLKGEELVFAFGGNDLIDATASVGNNRIYGGDGDYTIILGTGDRAIASADGDQFFAGVGGNSN